MNTLGERLPVAFEKGEGMKLYSTDGKEYNDFLGGIAVNSLGHSNPKFIKALLNTDPYKMYKWGNPYVRTAQQELNKTSNTNVDKSLKDGVKAAQQLESILNDAWNPKEFHELTNNH